MKGNTACSRLEEMLLAHSAVGDCAIVERVDARGETRKLAYVVKTSPVTNDELRSILIADGFGPRDLIVPVSAIPVGDDGEADEARLASFPVCDLPSAVAWANEARAAGLVAEAAAVVQESRPVSLPLHLADVLPSHVHRQSGAAAGQGRAFNACARPSSNTPAMSDGGSLELADDAPRLLADTLMRAARSEAPNGIVYVEANGVETCQTYGSLLHEARSVLSGLRASGIRPGEPVVLQLARHRDFIPAFWGSVLGGFVPVPLAPAASNDKMSASLQGLAAVWEALGRPAIVVDARSYDGVLAATSRAQLDGIRVLVVDHLRGEPDLSPVTANPDDLALLMLTSGSTGTPKPVRLTHRNLLLRSAGSRQLNGFSTADVTLNWMPLDHVAGLIYFHLRDVYLACRQVHVPTETVLQDPLRWLDLLERHKANVTFAPNFAYGLVNDHAARLAARHMDLSSVHSILNGAEAIVARTARRFMTLLAPHGLRASAMKPAWGMSETSSGVTYGDRFSLATVSDDDPFVEVGRPIPGVAIRIVDGDGAVVTEGAVGRLQISGATMTSGYYGNEEATSSAFTADGWFNTGDLGFILDGRLTITGREKDVVIVNSVNYYCHAIESVVETLEDVEPSYTAACAVRRASADTDSLAIFFHPRDPHAGALGATLKRIRTEVGSKIGVAPEFVVPVDREAIPKTSLGKIQRSELGRRLTAGEFDQTLRLVDRITGSVNTIPDWFFRKVWRPGRSIESARAVANATALVFVDRHGIAIELCRALADRGVSSITVEAGRPFSRTGEASYAIDPSSDDDYVALFEQLRKAGQLPTHVVQLWGLGGAVEKMSPETLAAAQDAGALSAVRLAKAMLRPGDFARVRMIFVGSHVQRVDPGDAVACEKTPVLGLLKSIPQELPWLECRHVDLDEPHNRAVGSIVSEMFTGRSDREVAYRNGRRFVSGLEKAILSTDQPTVPVVEPHGFWLITGGAGGIGTVLAKELLDRFHLKLLLVGRGELVGDRRQALDELRRSGEVAYEQVDVCDGSRLGEIVRRYESGWSTSLRGAFHLAGTYRERLAKDEDAAGVLEMLAPKTNGTAVLHSLLAERGGGSLVCASSLAGFFGGATIGAYAAASCFQDAFAEAHHGREGVDCWSFAWSNWDGIGQSMALQIRDLPKSRGYRPMEPQRAIQSLLIGMSRRTPSLVIGVDGNHPHIRRHRKDDAGPTDRLRIYYTPGSLARSDVASAAIVCDDFGTPSQPELVCLREMPRTASGSVDFDEARRVSDGGSAKERPAPRTDRERRLAGIWQRILGAPSVSAADNFFDLGGDSLLAARLVAEIRGDLHVEVTLRQVFDAATLAHMAATVETAAPVTRDEDEPKDSPRPRAGQLLDRLEAMPDDEVDALLQEFANESAAGE
jgi:acyl-CoA synthetase (AMP-forming)/AMP-acid ligase II/NAD(P)-dependent dehydrogenase (short-subunit alcohol dehydrogenase family)